MGELEPTGLISKPKRPEDAHRAARQFERLLRHSMDAPEGYKPKRTQEYYPEPDPEDRVIATITYYPDQQRVEIKRE